MVTTSDLNRAQSDERKDGVDLGHAKDDVRRLEIKVTDDKRKIVDIESALREAKRKEEEDKRRAEAEIRRKAEEQRRLASRKQAA